MATRTSSPPRPAGTVLPSTGDPSTVMCATPRQTPFGLDGQFTYQGLVERTNTDLANDLGNLLHRTLGMLDRYLERKVPRPPAGREPVDAGLIAVADGLAIRVDAHLRGCQFSLALEAIWELVRSANQYVQRNEPWVLAKAPDRRGRLADVLYNLTEVCRLLSVWLAPFMPGASHRMRDRLGLPAALEGTLDDLTRWGQMPPETAVHRGDPLFPRVELDDM